MRFTTRECAVLRLEKFVSGHTPFTDAAKRSFKDSLFGETWIETGEAPDWQRLYERGEPWQLGIKPRVVCS